MKAYILIVSLVLLGYTPSNAQCVRKVILNNGSEYNGYISSQIISDGKMIFHSENSIEYSPEKDIKYDPTANNAYITKHIDGRESIIKVELIDVPENGKSKYRITDTLRIGIDYEEIREIVSVSPDSSVNTISDIEREYTYSNGKIVKGTFLKEVPGKTVTLQDSLHKNVTVDMSSVCKLRFLPLNPKQNIFQQSLFLDKIIKKDGSNISNGVIIEKNYESENPDSFYLVFLHEKKFRDTILFNQIAELKSEINKGYNPIKMHILKKGEMMVNGEFINKTVSLNFPTQDENLRIENQNKSVAYFYRDGDLYNIFNTEYGKAYAKGDSCEIIVEFNDINLENQNIDDVQLIPNLKSRNKEFQFTKKDLAKKIKATTFNQEGRSGTVMYRFKVPISNNKKIKGKPDKIYYAVITKTGNRILPIVVNAE